MLGEAVQKVYVGIYRGHVTRGVELTRIGPGYIPSFALPLRMGGARKLVNSVALSAEHPASANVLHAEAVRKEAYQVYQNLPQR
jgi:hypothetical protein